MTTTSALDPLRGWGFDVLHDVARGDGYALIGPHDRVCAVNTTRPQRPAAVDLPRHRHDAVQQLLVAGLLRVAGRFVIDDHGHGRGAHDLVLTMQGRAALDTDRPVPRCLACSDTGRIPDAGYPRWSPQTRRYTRQHTDSPCHHCPAGQETP